MYVIYLTLSALIRPRSPETRFLLQKSATSKGKRCFSLQWFIVFVDDDDLFFRQKHASRRPEGMHREVFALLYTDKKDAPPLLPTDTALGIGAGYKQNKARLGMKKVRKWEWAPFSNPARNDAAVFHHWKRVSDDSTDYPFAKFNKQLEIPTYTMTEYNAHLRNNIQNWSKVQTDHLFDLARR